MSKTAEEYAREIFLDLPIDSESCRCDGCIDSAVESILPFLRAYAAEQVEAERARCAGIAGIFGGSSPESNRSSIAYASIELGWKQACVRIAEAIRRAPTETKPTEGGE